MALAATAGALLVAAVLQAPCDLTGIWDAAPGSASLKLVNIVDVEVGSFTADWCVD